MTLALLIPIPMLVCVVIIGVVNVFNIVMLVMLTIQEVQFTRVSQQTTEVNKAKTKWNIGRKE